MAPDPQVLVPRAFHLLDEEVNLRDECTRNEIRQLVEALVHWCWRIQPEEPASVQSVTGPQDSSLRLPVGTGRGDAAYGRGRADRCATPRAASRRRTMAAAAAATIQASPPIGCGWPAMGLKVARNLRTSGLQSLSQPLAAALPGPRHFRANHLMA